MSTSTKIAAFVAVAALGGACKETPKEKMEDAQEHLRESKQEAAEGNLPEAREELREARQEIREAEKQVQQDHDPAAYATRVESDLAALDRDMTALEARARAAGVEVRKDLRDARTTLQQRVDRFKSERWEETKGDVEAAMGEIDRELDELRKSIESNLRELDKDKAAPGTPPPS